MEEKDIYKHKFEFLLKAIDDAQNTIRFSDSKAMAVIGFWTLVIGTLVRTKSGWFSWLNNLSNLLDYLLVYGILFIIAAYFCRSIWLAYMVLVPRNAPIDHILKEGVPTKGLFYLHEIKPKIEGKYLYNNSNQLKLAMKSLDYKTNLKDITPEEMHDELILELQKVSFIRNVKISRVNLAISSIIQSLIALFVLGIYWIGGKTINFEGEKNLFDFSLNIELFIVLYIAHKVGDYLFQTDRQAQLKSQSFSPLLTHSLVYTFVTMGFAWFFTGYFNWAAILIILISHLIIDNRKFLIWWANYIKRIEEPQKEEVKPALLELDQAFHYIILFIISYIQ